MRHRGMLSELGKLWVNILFVETEWQKLIKNISMLLQGHLNDGYGVCIRHYTKLLINKLEFHDRNPRIPANLTMKRGELEAIGGGDINF